MPAIPLMVPDLPSADAILPFLRQIDTNRWYTNFGPLVRDFEKALAGQLDPMSMGLGVVTMANATVGLEIALQAVGLLPGARVLVPALTFVATATAVRRAGFEPVLADVDPHNWVLTPEIATGALPLVDAVMPVAAYGCPQDIEAWEQWSEQHGIPVVIDAAGAFGNQPVGRVPTVFSLHATKSMGVGEGGFVASTDRNYLERVKRLSNFGFGPNHGDVVEAGTNGKMSEYHAAVGLAALPHWRARREIRLGLQVIYRQELRQHCPEVSLQEKPEGVLSIFAVKLPEGIDAWSIASRMASHGVETRRWYCPALFDHPAFAECRVSGDLCVSRDLSKRILGLPFHVQLTNDDISTICTELAAAIERDQIQLERGSLDAGTAPMLRARPFHSRSRHKKPRTIPRV